MWWWTPIRWWSLAKQFPKYALVFGIILGSSLIFGIWWISHWRAKHQQVHGTAAADLAAIQRQAAKAEARIDYLFLADDDLYDAGTGELIFKNWLHGDHPVRLFYDAKTTKILGQYAEGFVRYNFDGSREAVMMQMVNPPAFSPDFKRAVYVKNKDVWKAEIDWQKLTFANEHKVTTMGVFYDQHFSENVVLLTEKTLVVRNVNNLLRVDLESGKVAPSRLPLKDIARRRSPDSKWVAGWLGGQFYCYDVDADDSKTVTVGRNELSEYLWLGNDKCLALAAGKTVVAYNRPDNSLTEVTTLPFSCFKMGEPSPDGRYLFAAGGIDGRNGALVELEKKAAVPVKGGAGITWVSNDTFAFSRNVPDSDLRGTWLQTVEMEEKLISPEPYLVTNAGARLLVLPTTSLVVFEMDHSISTMGSNSLQLVRFVKIDPSSRVLRMLGLKIEQWE